MNTIHHHRELAQQAMEELLIDLLNREQVFDQVGVAQITRLDGERPSWYLWLEDGRGVYQLELKDIGQVFSGGPEDVQSSYLEMEADFVLRYHPMSEMSAA